LLNFILININIMGMKGHMLICLFRFMLVGRKKEWDRWGNEVSMNWFQNCFWNCTWMIIQKIMQNQLSSEDHTKDYAKKIIYQFFKNSCH
jgi:hypothetical protein